MATSAYYKFNTFVEDLGLAVHDLSATGDTIKVYLTNAIPSAADDSVKTDLAEITAGNGYTAGGADVVNTWSQTSGTASMAGTSFTFTADGGSIGPYQYAVFYNSTTTVKTDPLIGYYDYGSTVTQTDGESMAINLPTNIFSIA